MLVWFRILTQLRLFKTTRALIRLIIEVVKDMYAFTLVLTIAVICFTITYGILVTAGKLEDDPISSDFLHIYLLMLGDFQYDDYTYIIWLMFIFASIFMPLIMLNLLISIMGNTFGRVSDSMEIADGAELNSLILE